MSEDSLKKETIFPTAPEVLSIIWWRCGDGEKKHEACHSGQDVDSEMQVRASLLYVEKRCGSFGESSSSGHYILYTWDKYVEMVYNDSDVHHVLWNSIKQNISTGGCLFFYINKECAGINAKRASTVKVVRRRRKVKKPVQPVPSSKSIVYEEVELLLRKTRSISRDHAFRA